MLIEKKCKSIINKQINQLQKEINSCWPYPNKDLKRTKIEFLQGLLKLEINDFTSFSQEVEKLIKTPRFTRVFAKTLADSSRTEDVVRQIETILRTRNRYLIPIPNLTP